MNEQGIAQVPALKGIPDFNLEEELASAGEFLVEPAPPGAAAHHSARGNDVPGRRHRPPLPPPTSTTTSSSAAFRALCHKVNRVQY